MSATGSPVRTATDTSVVIASLLSWHERHAEARVALHEALTKKTLIAPAPVLIEAYSVMTRLPAPHRLSPTDSWALLEATFRNTLIVALDETEVWSLLESAQVTGVAGGRTYDAHIMACARKANAKRLLTLNPRDFEALEVEGIAIEGP